MSTLAHQLAHMVRRELKKMTTNQSSLFDNAPASELPSKAAAPKDDEPSAVKVKAMEYGEAWRSGNCDGLGRALVLALRLESRIVAEAIFEDGMRKFGPHFEIELEAQRITRDEHGQLTVTPSGES